MRSKQICMACRTSEHHCWRVVQAPAATLAVFASSIAHFNDEDVRLLREAALSLLLHEEVGASGEWHNPSSTDSGKVNIAKAFSSTDGFRCEVLRVDNSAAGWHGRASYAVCEIHPGDWKLHPDARPKPSEKEPESANQQVIGALRAICYVRVDRMMVKEPPLPPDSHLNG